MPIITISPISDNEAKKDRGNRHAPQNLTADHLTGLKERRLNLTNLRYDRRIRHIIRSPIMAHF